MSLFGKLFSRRKSEEASEKPGTIDGMALPNCLLGLIELGAWKTPSDDQVRAALPGVRSGVRFLETVEAMRSESLETIADHMNTARIFKVYRGSIDEAKSLPWLDVEKAVVIGVGDEPDVDLAIVLDFREDPNRPKVVYSDWWTERGVCNWVECYPSAETFAEAFGFET
ncbi:hypothetical protein [Pelagicoccus mobilis]|uniref:Uncharacterized protein n=1 Tax=Pelagicoccus mobilis TaxID=415221 RepID=A0A934VKU9_9BACT|nr:hypothetical protein [Pelagicoccus mobilis]MBK1877071.1 hypothetical protein [Pelagicoccus mobilis]